MSRPHLRLLRPSYSDRLPEELAACGLDPRLIPQFIHQGLQHLLWVPSISELFATQFSQHATALGLTFMPTGAQANSTGLSGWLLAGSRHQLHALAAALSTSSDPDVQGFSSDLRLELDSALGRGARGLSIRNLHCTWQSRTYIMGIVNMTPDSFSGDGILRPGQRNSDPVECAIQQGLALVSEGADILDIGGESSRPGSEPVDAQTEMQRILPVIRGIRQRSDIPLSVDTTKAAVLAAALDAGADLLNDISAMQADPEMQRLAAQRRIPVILMHRSAAHQDAVKRGILGGYYHQGTRPTLPELGNMLDDVVTSLRNSVNAACQAGVAPESLIIDPGIGFGKVREENLFLVNHLDALQCLGSPILLGVSRKAFIGYTLDTPVQERLEGTLAAVTVGIIRGADIIRVHDVKQAVRAARMADALVRHMASREGAA